MKYIILLCYLFIVPAFTGAQTYYVAIIKGDVTYNGKKLKKRAKITAKGELRFGAPEDYIKVSGPGGVFTFRAYDKNARGEFVTALSQELFPLAKARNSFSHSLAVNNQISYFFGQLSSPLWEQTIALPDSLRSRFKDVYFVADSQEGGVLTRRAAKKNGRVKFSTKPFAGEVLGKVQIVLVNDYPVWEARLSAADSVVHLGAQPEFWPVDAETARPEVLLMNSYYPGRMVDRKTFQRELRRQVKYLKPASTDEMLEDAAVQDLFEEMFGISIFPNDAWKYVSSLLKQ